MDKILKYITPVLLLILILTTFLDVFNKKGMSEAEHELKLQLHDLKQENALKQKRINQYEVQIKKFENEILKNDSIINNATNNELDSMFTDYFSR